MFCLIQHQIACNEVDNENMRIRKILYEAKILSKNIKYECKGYKSARLRWQEHRQRATEKNRRCNEAMEFKKFIVAVCQREIWGSSSTKHEFIDHVDIKFTTKTAFGLVNILFLRG